MKQIEFINQVFELAFGENARPEFLNNVTKDDRRMPFTLEEVLEKIEMYANNSFKVEDLDESEGFVEGDIVKIDSVKYKVHFEGEKLFLQTQEEIDFLK